MQRRLVNLSALAAAISVVVTAHAEVNIPSLKGGFKVGVEANYLQPYGLNTIYGHDVASDTQSITTKVLTNDPKFKFGFGLNIDYLFPGTANDLGVNYSHYSGKTDDFYAAQEQHKVTLPTFIANFIESFHPDDFYIDSAASAVEIKQDQVDLLAGHFINLGNNLVLHLNAGLSYTRLADDNNLSYFGYVDGPDDRRVLLVNYNARFSGMGPALGIDSTYHFANTGFGLTAGIQTALYVGKQDFNISANFKRDDGAITNSSNESLPSKSKVVPSVAMNLGLSYARAVNNDYNLEIEGGYRVKSYINALVDLNNDVSTVSDASLTFAGPYLNLKLAVC